MTDRELLQQSLNVLRHLCLHSRAVKGYDGEQVQAGIDALKARLARPEPAECDGGQCGIGGYCKDCPKTQPEPVIQARKEGNLIVVDMPQVPRGSGGISKDTQPELTKRGLAKIHQAAWRAVHKDYRDDPECCFALGFDAGFGAVALRVEPPVSESGAGFESLPASPNDEWVELTATDIKILRRAVNNDREFAVLIQAKIQWIKNTQPLKQRHGLTGMTKGKQRNNGLV